MLSGETSNVDLQDIQSEADHRGITIDQVGIRRLRIPVRVPAQNGTVQASVASVSLTVELPSDRKGTHMSRFVELLNEGDVLLDAFHVNQLLRLLCQRLHSPSASAVFEFPFFTEKIAPVSHSKGLMDYNVTMAACHTAKGIDAVTTVAVPVTTLCPCSKAISAHGAHNQRGEVKFSVRAEQAVWLEELISMAESSASSELYSLLKRSDEKAVTERAFHHPVFVEDLVRNLAAAADARPEILWYRIEAENFESIHNHNAYALLERWRDGQPAAGDR